MKRDTLINEYISAVSSEIICNAKKKRAFLYQLKQDVEAFVDEKKNATRQDVESVFGSPEAIAISFISNSESSELKKKMSVKTIVIFALAIALLIYLAFIVISLIDVHAEAHGYLEEGILCIFRLCMKGGAI